MRVRRLRTTSAKSRRPTKRAENAWPTQGASVMDVFGFREALAAAQPVNEP
jgi:hypothetical protein